MKRKRIMSSDDDEEIEIHKRHKMMSPTSIMEEEMIPLADLYNKMRSKRAVSREDDDDDISVMEVYEKMKPRKRRRRPISVKKNLMRTPITRKEEEEEEVTAMRSSSPLPKLELFYDGSSSDIDDEKLSEEDSEEEKKYIRRSPVLIKDFSDYFHLELCGFDESEEEPEESEQESDEELVCECDRDEVDWGCNYVLRKRWRTITNPLVPKKTYFKHDDSDFTINVLHDPEFPLATLSKLALEIYNAIQGTQYEYVGLVKAYMQAVAGFNYYIRFKARVHGQDTINFQASIYQGILLRKTNVVPVCVEYVYPLPP